MRDPAELIIRRVIDKYGHKHQTLIAMEELGELQHELSKFIRDKGDRNHLIEEYADVCIVLKELKTMYNITDAEIYEMVDKKFTRLEDRLDEGQKDVLKPDRNE